MTGFLKHLFSHHRFVYMLIALFMMLGIKAMWEMPSSIYPPLTFPRVVVVAENGDKAPDQVVIQITRPLEDAISTIPGVKRIRSKTIRGSTELSVEFIDGTDMIQALTAVQGRVAMIQGSLPSDVNLTIERLTPGTFPVMTFNISSPGLPLTDIQEIVKYQIQPVLRRVPGVARVLSSGGDVRELDIEIDPQQLQQSHLTPQLLTDAIQKTNRLSAVGKIQSHYQQPLILHDSRISALEDFENLSLLPSNSLPLRLGSAAAVYQGIQPRTSLVSGRHGLCISVSILKQPDANMITVSHDVLQAIRELKPHIPADIRIEPVYDQAELVQDSVNNVEEAILLGSCFIVAVLFLFLRDWRATLSAALTIPITVLCTFWIMSLAGQDFNLMSMGGLAVAIGLVIDDAIVMIENIHRCHKLTPDASLTEIIHQATHELAGPIISSTLTTVVVFLPLALLSGIAGQFFQALSFTLTTAVLISLGLALLVLPLLSRHLLSPVMNTGRLKTTFDFLEAAYLTYLRGILQHPKFELIGVSILVLLGGFLAFQLPTGFMPDMDEGAYVIDYFSPPGTSLQTANDMASQIEAMLAKTPEVTGWSRRTGAELGFFATEQSRGDILVRLKPKEHRHRSVFEIIESQRHQLETRMPRVKTDFIQILQDQLNDLAGAPAPLEVKVYGEQPAVLVSLAKRIENRMHHIRGLTDIKLGTQISSPEIHLKPIPLALAQAGLTADDLQHQLETGIAGSIISQFRMGDKFINVRLRYPEYYRNHLKTLPIFTPGGALLPLASLEDIVYENGPGQIQRENQQRLISIEGAPEYRDLGGLQNDILSMMARFQLSAGYHLNIGGLYESQHQAFGQLIQVLLLSGLLVFAVMVFQFKSFIKPLLIIAMIPIGLSGVIWVLWLTQTPLNVSSLMGMILLTGLIVKNGIILVSYTDQLWDQHGEKPELSLQDAVIEAAHVRLRPILMTTLATMLGLLPLTLGWGSGSELQKPLAIAVIGGLLFSTYMSLTFLPWLYLKAFSGKNA